MSRAIAAARPSTESAVAAGQLPTRQSIKPRRPKLIDAPRQSKPCQHVDQRQLSLRSAASSHPDCRAVLIQIVAQYLKASLSSAIVISRKVRADKFDLSRPLTVRCACHNE